MTSLTQQLEQLKKQQLEVEKRIQGNYKNIKNKQSMETEDYIKTFTEYLEQLKRQQLELEKIIQENKSQERLKKNRKIILFIPLNI